jgi:hypothetical protein
MIPAGDVLTLDNPLSLLDDSRALAAAQERLRAGDLYVARKLVDPDWIAMAKGYLRDIGRHSLPTYQPIAPGAPNFHRLNRNDPRAYVKGSFHQFVFYAWNQDVLDLFARARPVYHLKNRLSGLAADSFLGQAPDRDCTARLAFQLYPRGGGYLNQHVDPIDFHQLTAPILQMSRRGEDFERGGLYVVDRAGGRLMLDDLTEPGDVVFFNAANPHGVEPIDPDRPLDWLAYQGRWMLLFAVNRVAGSRAIGDSVDLGQTTAPA